MKIEKYNPSSTSAFRTHFVSLELFAEGVLWLDPPRARSLWSAVFDERKGAGLHGYDYGSMIYYLPADHSGQQPGHSAEDEWQIAADIREGQINSFPHQAPELSGLPLQHLPAAGASFIPSSPCADRSHLPLFPH